MPRTHKSPASRLGGSGHRRGQKGVGYANRSDLNAGTAAMTQNLLSEAQPNIPQGTLPPPGPAQMAPPKPVVPLHAPTQRPYEAVTAGLPLGGGPGAEVLGLVPDNQTITDALKGAYSAHPDDQLRAMIAQMGNVVRPGGR